jgi:glycosyltransferase involved in cell wall biosynthesis
VLFISFENQWVKLLGLADLPDFASRYTLVLAPSGSPHNLISYAFPALYPGPLFTLISNPHDPAVLARVAANLVVVPLYASSWVNPDLFAPLPRSARTYDLIMVANFAKFKRHQALFAALRAMPRDLRLLLIGQDQDGRTADTIRELARWYGVADRFELRSNQTYTEVVRAFCQARASVVLSRREGSCVAVAESLFADTPAALLQGAEIGSRVFLNEQTGRFLHDDTLAAELTALVAEAQSYQPRAWAEQHIACWQSSRFLNDLLRQHALAAGQDWTQDIAPLQWCPDPQPARAEDRQRLAAERAEIRTRYGLDIGSN